MNRSTAAAAGTAAALPALGFVLLAGNTLLWGTNWPVMKIILSEIGPWTFRAASVVIAGFGALAVAALAGQSLRIPRGRFGPVLLNGLLSTTGWYVFSAVGLTMIGAGRATILAFTMPLWAAVLSMIVLKTKLTGLQIFGLMLGVAGLLLLIGPELTQYGQSPLGSLLMVGAAVSWAGGTIVTKHFDWGMPTLVLVGWQIVLGGVPIVLGALWLEPVGQLLDLSLLIVVAILYTTIVTNLYCIWAWFRVVALFPAHIAAIGIIGVPVVGVFSSALILGEAVLPREIAALILVCCALTVVMVLPAVLRRVSARNGAGK